MLKRSTSTNKRLGVVGLSAAKSHWLPWHKCTWVHKIWNAKGFWSRWALSSCCFSALCWGPLMLQKDLPRTLIKNGSWSHLVKAAETWATPPCLKSSSDVPLEVVPWSWLEAPEYERFPTRWWQHVYYVLGMPLQGKTWKNPAQKWILVGRPNRPPGKSPRVALQVSRPGPWAESWESCRNPHLLW